PPSLAYPPEPGLRKTRPPTPQSPVGSREVALTQPRPIESSPTCSVLTRTMWTQWHPCFRAAAVTGSWQHRLTPQDLVGRCSWTFAILSRTAAQHPRSLISTFFLELSPRPTIPRQAALPG